jgi:hypothetical protein
MYFFDPERGAYRRSLLQDKLTSWTNRCCEGMDVVTRDFNNRLQGFTAEMRGLRNLSQPVADDVLCGRIRSKLGRYSSHPRAIEVDVADGRVTLRGPTLASEAQRVFDVVRGMAGVHQVTNEMEAHQSAENIPALQGGRHVMGEPIDLMQENWSPTTKFMLGLAGASFLITGSLRAACWTTGLGAVGLGMAAGGFPASGQQGSWQRGRSGGSHQDTSGKAMGDAMARGAQTARSSGISQRSTLESSGEHCETGAAGGTSAEGAGAQMGRTGFNTTQ